MALLWNEIWGKRIDPEDFVRFLAGIRDDMDVDVLSKLSKKIWDGVPAEQAAVAANSLMTTHIIPETLSALAFSYLAYCRESVSPAALAAMFRFIWPRYGLFPRDDVSLDMVVEQISWMREKARAALMSEAERGYLAALPRESTVQIYRGEPAWEAVEQRIWGVGWTLSRSVANYYTYVKGQRNGRLVTGTVRVADILAAVFDDDEHEIIVDPRKVVIASVERGDAHQGPRIAYIASPARIYTGPARDDAQDGPDIPF